MMLIQRMLRAARLDPDLFYQVARDDNSIRQAFLIVLIVGACPLLGGIFAGHNLLTILFLAIPSAIGAAGGWIGFSAVAQYVGDRMGGRTSFEHLLGPVGFAHTPGLLQLFGFFPGAGLAINWIAWIWGFAALTVAVREAMRIPTGKAALVTLLTMLILAIIGFVLCLLTGTTFNAVGFLLSPLRGGQPI
jgi:hypothetical protein